mmetsp:Transcript_13833/g.28000  ORF Transcript_13833/g.28000 Transcript_13833/m.28000 type:complete len:384 (+) Transcript_13833:1-1152(+)
MLATCPAGTRQGRKFLPVVAQIQTRGFHSTKAPRKWDVQDVKIGGRSSVSGITATVFGATGSLGPLVVNRLGKIGSRVVVPFRDSGMSARPLKLMGDLGQIIPVPYSIDDPESIEKAIAKSDVVINCIGNPYETRNFSYRNTYVDANEALVKACTKAGVKRYLNVSAVNASLDSESTWLQANAEADALVHSEFADATTLKVTRIFGRMDRFVNQYASLANQSPITPLVNNGENLVQPVYDDDVAAAIVSAVLKPESMGKTYYLGGPETVMMKEFIAELHKDLYLTNKGNMVPLPMRAARAFGYFLQQFRFFVRPFAVITEDEIVQLQYDNVVPDGVPTIEDLDVTTPTKLMGPLLEELSIVHRGERGPDVVWKGRRTWDEVKV